MPAVGARPSGRELPGQQIVDADLREPGHAEGKGCRDGTALVERALAHVQRLGKLLTAADPDLQELEGNVLQGATVTTTPSRILGVMELPCSV